MSATSSQVVPETLLKKRKATEKAQAAKLTGLEARKVRFSFQALEIFLHALVWLAALMIVQLYPNFRATRR